MHRVTRDRDQFVRCRIGTQSFAISAAAVSSIQEGIALSPPTAEPEHQDRGIVGTLLQRGERMPVYCLAERLGLSDDSAPQRDYLILLQAGDRRFALRVVGAPRILELPRAQQSPLPRLLLSGERQFFTGLLHVPQTQDSRLRADDATSPDSTERNAQMLLLLNPDSLLHDDVPPSAPAREPAPPPALTAPVARTARRRQLLIFQPTSEPLYDRHCAFGVGVTQIVAVSETLPIQLVPGAPRDVPGFVIWRSRPVPIVNLARRCGFQELQPRAENRLVIARGTLDDELLAFPVLPSIRAQRLPVTNTPCGFPSRVRPEWFRGCYRLERETLLVPDLARIATCGPCS